MDASFSTCTQKQQSKNTVSFQNAEENISFTSLSRHNGCTERAVKSFHWNYFQPKKLSLISYIASLPVTSLQPAVLTATTSYLRGSDWGLNGKRGRTLLSWLHAAICSVHITPSNIPLGLLSCCIVISDVLQVSNRERQRGLASYTRGHHPELKSFQICWFSDS